MLAVCGLNCSLVFLWQLFESLLSEAPSADGDEAQDNDEDDAEVDSWAGKTQLQGFVLTLDAYNSLLIST